MHEMTAAHRTLPFGTMVKVKENLNEELPFMASEAILMEAVKRGGDRQELHERLRIHSREATTAILESGEANPFLALVAADPEVPLDQAELDTLMDPVRFIGRAPEQVAEYLRDHVRPLLDAAGELPEAGDLEI
jgi:adenylosuccinate lyase